MFQSVSLNQPTCPHENFLRSCKVPKGLSYIDLYCECKNDKNLD
jgi:hypothetical protein